MMNRLAYIVASAMLLSACAGVEPLTPAKPADTNTRVADAGTTGNTRLCTMELGSVTVARLGKYFSGKIVRNIEGPVTYCLTISGGSTNVDATFRIEYEDDSGISSYTIDSPNNVFYGKVDTADNGTVTVDIIFIDNYGFTQITGTAPPAPANFNGVIKFYNFPSYSDAIDAQAQEAAQKCKNGTYTVAQCLGYNFPQTYWWNQPTYTSYRQYMIDQAHAILNDPSKTTQLGTVSFDIADVLNQ